MLFHVYLGKVWERPRGENQGPVTAPRGVGILACCAGIRAGIVSNILAGLQRSQRSGFRLQPPHVRRNADAAA
jgi:hypothetical protein